jgi:hypothetical protein
MRARRYAAVAAAAIFAAVAIAPASAGATARTDKYSGPIDLPELPNDTPGPASIDLTVKAKSKKKGKKPKPKLVTRLKTHNVYMTCEDGTHVYPADNNSEFDITYGIEFPGAKIKKRKFSTTDPATGEFGTGITLTGRVPKKGPASGTIRIQLDLSDSTAPELGKCDTGTLGWTADKL